jgi:hypothetical protein
VEAGVVETHVGGRVVFHPRHARHRWQHQNQLESPRC